MSNILKKYERLLSAEMRKQQDLQYTSAAMVLNKRGWDAKKIKELFLCSGRIWDECGADPNKSVLSMLEDETGVAMTLENGKVYDDYDFLSKTHPRAVRRITDGYLVAIRRAQIEWCGACVLGALFLALHRFDNWDYNMLMTFQDELDETQKNYNFDVKKMLSDTEKKAGVKMLWGEKK
jgi:hypothetical protein